MADMAVIVMLCCAPAVWILSATVVKAERNRPSIECAYLFGVPGVALEGAIGTPKENQQEGELLAMCQEKRCVFGR